MTRKFETLFGKPEVNQGALNSIFDTRCSIFDFRFEVEHSLVEIERAPSLDWIRPFQEPYPKQGAQYVKAIVGPPSGQE